MTDGTIRLDLTLEHAAAVASLIDLATRIHMGQVSEILAMVENRNLPIRDDSAPDCKRPATQDEADRIEDALINLRRALGHPSGSHFGIAKSSKEARLGYEVQKTIQKTLHDHLTPDVRGTVHSQGLMVRYAEGEAPRAEIVRT